MLQGQFTAHDPSRIIRCNGRYYVYATGPNIRMRYSDDLVHWSNGQDVLAPDDTANGVPPWARAASPGNTGNVVWAPDVVFTNGLYRLYYSFSTFGSPNSVIGLVTSPTLDPSASNYHWTDQGLVIGSSTTSGGPNCIDPCPVSDSAGNMWLSLGSYNNYGIGLIRLDNATGLRSYPNSTIYRLAGTNIEASYVLYHGGCYYLFVNIGTCCQGANSTYHILMGRAIAITGPYTDKNGVDMVNGGGTPFLATAGSKIGPGHVGVYDDGTMERLTYHLESDGTNYGASTLNVQTLLWGADGWPVAGSDLPDGDYKIVSKATGLALGVHNGSTEDGALLDQNVWSSSAFQRWTVAATSGGTPQTGKDGYNSMTSGGDGKVADLYYCRPANGTTIDQYPWFNNACQRWLIEQTTDGYYRIVSQGGGGVVTVPENSQAPGAPVQEWAWTGGDNQKWSFLPPRTAADALTFAGGLGIATQNDAASLDVETGGASAGRIDLLDAERHLRRAAGLD